MTNKEKFFELVSQEQTNTLAEIKKRNRERIAITAMQKLSLNILVRLDELGWSQKDLAKELGVTPQQVNKWVKGNGNITMETAIKLGFTLGLEIFEPVFEGFMNSLNSETSFKETQKFEAVEYAETCTTVIETKKSFDRTIEIAEKHFDTYKIPA